MDVDRSELRQQFDMQETEELLDRYWSTDLTDLARNILISVLDARGVTQEHLEAPVILQEQASSFEQELRWPDARACYQKIIALDPHPDMKAKVFVKIMMTYEEEGDYQNASISGQKALSFSDDSELDGFIQGRLLRMKLQQKGTTTKGDGVFLISIFTVLTLIAWAGVIATMFFDIWKENDPILWIIRGAAILFALLTHISYRRVKGRRF